MKKNVMMRVASVILVMVLMTTSVISGTFAKYVTADNGSDSARVAKWGVMATVEGNLFSDSYKNAPTTYTKNETEDDITVQAEAEGTDVVAPGTQNDKGMKITLTGTPEVDVKVEFKMEVVENKEIKLVAGNYLNPTTGNKIDFFNVKEDYYPVVFTLSRDDKKLVSGNVKDIQDYLTENLNKTYEANTDLSQINSGTSGVYTLTWNWAFENPSSDDPAMDAADTYLGNAIAGGSAEGATTDIAVKFSVSATQVD